MTEMAGLLTGEFTFTRAPSLPAGQAREEMFERHEMLEETSASLAAVRGTDDDLLAIEAALAELNDDPADFPQSVKADLRFHPPIARVTHNRFVEMVLDPLTQVFRQHITLAGYFKFWRVLHGRSTGESW